MVEEVFQKRFIIFNSIWWQIINITFNATRITEMLGRFFCFFIKWKLKELQITWANILFTKEHREHTCLTWEIFQFYAQDELISNLMAATGLK